MKQDVLSRYKESSDGGYIVEIAASRIEDLYNNFDKNSPYIRRDLDSELVEYIVESAAELKGHDFSLCFTLKQTPDTEKQSRIRKSINAYFIYLASKEKQEVIKLFRKSAILLVVGLLIMFISVLAHESFQDKENVLLDVIAQGLTVAAWVSLWNAFAALIIEWLPLRKNINLYQHLANIKLQFLTVDS